MDGGFLSLLDSISGMTYTGLWQIILLGLMRFAPIVAIAPFLGAKLIPTVARMALAISLTMVFLPTMILYMNTSYLSPGQFIGCSIKELVVGFILGYFASLPFFIAQSSGIFIDFMRGSSQMMAQDPSTQTQSSPIGILFNYYLIVLFYSLDGPLLFFDAIDLSFQIIPIDKILPSTLFQNSNHFWQNASDTINQIFTISLQLAAPSILAILMAETFLGIANRLAPQVQIAFLGMPLKSLLGLTMLWAGWYFIIQKMSTMSIDYVKAIHKILPFLGT